MPRQILRLAECIKKADAYDKKTLGFIDIIAATIMGVKPASLVNVRSNQCINLCTAYSQVNENIKLVFIKHWPASKQLLIYHKRSLHRVLSDPQKAQYLQSLGYPINSSVEEAVGLLVQKLRSDDFPHELGLFIGYPLKDVRGFMGEKPIHYRKTMGWKMYGDTVPSERIYRQFEYARQFVRNMIQQEYEYNMTRSTTI